MRAAAAITLLAAIALAAVPAAPALAAVAAAPAVAARWAAPVAGEVTRGFAVGPDPFAGGQHRGADFAAAPGAPVRAACGGRVAVAGRVGASGRVVTIRCGPWRVTHQPLAAVAVVRGAHVARGARIGTVAPSRAHAGLHLGVRREGRPFGYVDPLRFIGADRPPPPTVRMPEGRRGPPSTAPVPGRPARASSRAVTAPAPAAAARSAERPLAPWPAWLGLGLLLAGAIGAGMRWRRPAPFRGRYGALRPAESRRVR